MTILDVIHDQVLKNLLKYLSRQIILFLLTFTLVFIVAQQHQEIVLLKEQRVEMNAVIAAVKAEQERRTLVVRAFEKKVTELNKN